jgi:hypothetical protein
VPLYNPLDSTAIVDGSVTSADITDGTITAADLTAPLGWGYLASGNYYITAAQSSAATSSAQGNGTLRLSPWMVPNSCTISRIGASVTVIGDSGSKVRLGIYADSGSGYPGALVLDAGTIAGDSATTQEITVSQALTAGLYWIGGAVQIAPSTQPTVVVTSGAPPFFGPMTAGTGTPSSTTAVVAYTQASVTGALPANFTASVAFGGSALRVFVKAA